MKCPTCGKTTSWDKNPFRPFCSERCKLVDLSRWVNEEYRVPAEKVSSDHPETKPQPEEFQHED